MRMNALDPARGDDAVVDAPLRVAQPPAKPDRLTLWIGVLFALGSACFAGASILAQWSSTSTSALAAVYFGGSLLFTAAAALVVAQGGPGRRAAVIQLAGTIFFNLSTLHSLQEVERTDLRVWAPDAFGSICFLVSSALAYAAMRARTRDWWIAVLNLLGSVAFGIAAVASLIEPSTSEPVSAAVSNIGTAIGAICFLAGAVLLAPGGD
jgi:hypothetical protein